MDVVANALCMCNARAHNKGTHDNVRVNPFVRVRAGKQDRTHSCGCHQVVRWGPQVLQVAGALTSRCAVSISCSEAMESVAVLPVPDCDWTMTSSPSPHNPSRRTSPSPEALTTGGAPAGRGLPKVCKRKKAERDGRGGADDRTGRRRLKQVGRV